MSIGKTSLLIALLLAVDSALCWLALDTQGICTCNQLQARTASWPDHNTACHYAMSNHKLTGT
jgi:hypothetical protein